MSSGIRDVELGFVVESSVVKVPVVSDGMGEWNCFGIKGHKDTNDKLVKGGGFDDFRSKDSIEQIYLKVGEEDLGGIVPESVNGVFSGEGIGWAHIGSRGVVPDKVIVRERHGYWLPTMGCGYGYL